MSLRDCFTTVSASGTPVRISGAGTPFSSALRIIWILASRIPDFRLSIRW